MSCSLIDLPKELLLYIFGVHIIQELHVKYLFFGDIPKTICNQNKTGFFTTICESKLRINNHCFQIFLKKNTGCQQKLTNFL